MKSAKVVLASIYYDVRRNLSWKDMRALGVAVKRLASIAILCAPFVCWGQSTLSPFAGSGPSGFAGDGGPATAARLSLYAFGLAADAGGNIYISDLGNYRVRKVNSAGIISTVAGSGTPGAGGDNGPALSAQLFSAMSISLRPQDASEMSLTT